MTAWRLEYNDNGYVLHNDRLNSKPVPLIRDHKGVWRHLGYDMGGSYWAHITNPMLLEYIEEEYKKIQRKQKLERILND